MSVSDGGRVPMGWRMKRLGELCEINPSKTSARRTLAGSQLVSFIPMNDVGVLTKIVWPEQKKPLKDVIGSYTYFADDDVLLAKITPCFENGKLGIVRGLTNGIGFGSSEFFVLRSLGEVDPEFLFYFLAQDSFRVVGARRMTGAVGHKRIPKEFVEEHPLCLPSLAEQRRIVALLDEAFVGIDAAVASAEKNLANARELFESWLTTVFRRQGEGWEEKRFSDLAENLDSKRIPITKSDRKSGDVPYYGASGVVDYVADYIFDEDLLLVSEDGANLLARTYPIAFSISGKAWVNNHAHVLRFSNRTLQRFVEYYLNSISLEPYISGMAQPKLNQKALNSIAVPVPSGEEQARIVSSLDALVLETARLDAVYQRKLDVFAELKQSILRKAFVGELTEKKAERALAAA